MVKDLKDQKGGGRDQQYCLMAMDVLGRVAGGLADITRYVQSTEDDFLCRACSTSASNQHQHQQPAPAPAPAPTRCDGSACVFHFFRSETFFSFLLFAGGDHGPENRVSSATSMIWLLPSHSWLGRPGFGTTLRSNFARSPGLFFSFWLAR